MYKYRQTPPMTQHLCNHGQIGGNPTVAALYEVAVARGKWKHYSGRDARLRSSVREAAKADPESGLASRLHRAPSQR